ncbi:Bromodomain containing protein [Tritrichomonas foetus]|uniref:Bromodomain containing protein n=1 Tax=Tritrichomonas foetus TaxID=1144522 RepID=A0A1J4JN36_9EUKA|nr:Bromodomain containing protein [Tritrichomonas foetus]|eukprot:OHS98955.1 Bromodomain containing protein [Tritrichomonas foetus]
MSNNNPNFTEQQRNAALKIMDNLMSHPITKIFHDPVDPEKAPPQYFEKIKSPQNLKDITSRLKSGKIATAAEWLNDVELCWSNAESFNGTINKFFTMAATESRKIFNRLRRGTEFVPIKMWCNDVYNLQKSELKYARHAPRKVNAFAASLDSYRQLKSDDLVPLSNAELKNFIQATSLISSEETSRGLVRILSEMQPDIKKSNSTELWIDVTKLELSTVRALRDYLKAELEKQGDRYPE